ncbi:hypothetical protein FIBSPDRAFT_239223 [Athelia psychrophila]|uniref:Uncharacterized protein n=1 Tax=Athelia psychrophila TaxID=1759441 RepID=A0A165YED3_9AGAM|nr:hypothetical protein FIBSPDRAFT_239223 [Fibularhizoctonia sp. CBS 109695]
MWYKFCTKHFPDDDLDWTVTHGFLVLMGGFYYLDHGKDPRPLSPKEVEDCITDGSLDLPTKSQINDKSKSGAFARTVASLQTIWFVMQSLARPIQQLPLTLLEVATMAYTLTTVALHGFWWSKPLNISQPFRVRCVAVPNPTPCTTFQELQAQESRGMLETLLRAVTGSQADDADLSQSGKVPTFYSGTPNEWESIQANVIALAFAMMFGAIHCAAWSFTFPSHAEDLIWRIASTAVVGIPAIFSFLLVLWACEMKAVVKKLLFVSIIAIPFYLLARMVLPVLAFTTMRSLPLAALETVQWTTLIPHI